MTAPPEGRAPILLDVFPGLLPGGGIGRYVRDLADALDTRADAPAAAFSYPGRLPFAVRTPWNPLRMRPLPFGWRRTRIVLVASARAGLRPDRWYGEPRVFHSPAGYGPIFGRSKLLLTIHDLTAVQHPEWHPGRTAFLVAQTLPPAAREATRVLCDSDHVRRQVLSLPGVRPERVETVHLSVDPGFSPGDRGEAREHVQRRFGIEGEFVLHVGTFEPRKNHAGLVAAFEALAAAGFAGPLVLVGQDGWRTGPVEARLAASPVAARIVRVRDARDADLLALYRSCTMFAFPSLEEGFGLPLLEAMACGAPSVTSAGSSLPEIAGDAAVLVDPQDSQALGDALVALWRSPERRDDLARRGPLRAAGFGRERWIARMFAIYRELLADAGSSGVMTPRSGDRAAARESAK